MILDATTPSVDQYAPVELRESLQKMRETYPDPTRIAFIMMKFGKALESDVDDPYNRIFSAIKKTLKEQGIVALRADKTSFHANLTENVLTHIYGSSFGIAVYEKIDANDFNPNVAFEVGYTLALGKPICLLKASNLPQLQSDLQGKLYVNFDIDNPLESISHGLSTWLSNKGIPNAPFPLEIDFPPVPQNAIVVASPSDVGAKHLETLLAKLPASDKSRFKDICDEIRCALQKAHPRSTGITRSFEQGTNPDLLEAIAFAHTTKGFGVVQSYPVSMANPHHQIVISIPQ